MNPTTKISPLPASQAEGRVVVDGIVVYQYFVRYGTNGLQKIVLTHF
jgi:hypothetical protein